MSFEKKTLHLGQDPTGASISTELFVFDSKKPGPTVFIPSSVHGAEVQGNLVLYHLMKLLISTNYSGKLILLPLANPLATRTKIGTMTYGRFNPVTGHNWNRNYIELKFDAASWARQHLKDDDQSVARAFKDEIEKLIDQEKAKRELYGTPENGRLNLELQKLAAQADIVLDLHTGPAATDYLYAPEYLSEDAKMMKIPFTLIVPHVFAGALDEAVFTPWTALKEAFKENKREFTLLPKVYTVELQSEEQLNGELAQKQLSRLCTYLTHHGVFKVAPFPEVDQGPLWQTLLHHYKTYYSPKGGLVEYLVKPGDHFKKGDTLARILSFKGVHDNDSLNSAMTEVKAIADGALINHYPSAVISEGHELFQVMENMQRL